MGKQNLITFFRGDDETDLGLSELLESRGNAVRLISDPGQLFSDETLVDSDLVLIQTGDETLKELIGSLKSPWLPYFTPVLLVLKDPPNDLRVFALERGASDILSIPFSREEFLVRVNSLLRVKLLYDELEKESIELQRSHSEARSEKMQMEAMLEAMGDGVVLVTNEGVIRKINGSARRMLGIGADERVTAATTERCRFDLAALVRHALSASGRMEPLEIAVDSGETSYIHARFWPVKDHLERTVGRMVVLTDVTKERVWELNKARFVMDISHELRTPLTSLTNALTILSSPSLPPGHAERRKFLSMALSNVKRMASLVLKLMDYSNVGPNTGAESQETADVVQIVAGVLEAASTECRRRDVEIRGEYCCESAIVSGEAGRLKSSIRELVDVVVKMSRAGQSIGVKVRTEDRLHNCESLAVVEISGLDSPEIIGKVWNIARMNAPETDDPCSIEATTGLAYNIGRRMIEMQKGSVSFVNRTDGTACMELRFPVVMTGCGVQEPAIS